MDYRKLFRLEPGKRLNLANIDPGFHGKHLTEAQAKAETEKHRDSISKLQDLMYSEGRHSLLIVLQAMDAGGKDGTVRHAMSTMNPIGTIVTSFKQPSAEDLKHDFLWRVHPHAPAKGMVAIFNRSHYEDVLVVRVHNLVPKEVWSERYSSINDFEKLLREQNNTHIIKFFFYISQDEQLKRFAERLDDPARNWKISEDDYREREFWDDYIEGLRSSLPQNQHQTCSLVHHPRQSQVVPQSRNLADCGRDLAGHEYSDAQAAGGPGDDPSPIPSGGRSGRRTGRFQASCRRLRQAPERAFIESKH